jgi:hypothetical protein
LNDGSGKAIHPGTEMVLRINKIMHWAQNRRKLSHIDHKKNALFVVDENVSQETFAQQFYMAKSVGNINKNRNMIFKAWENCCSKSKQKLHKTHNTSVKILTLECFQKCSAVDI